MGNGESRCNDSMIDELVKRDRIVARNLERALRLVDRGNFLPPSHRTHAYADIPFRLEYNEGATVHPGAIHLSTTDVYATVLHHLDLRKGQAFMNIGSGVGYLSTITGLLLGDSGINHGIELYQNLVDYADTRVDEWVTSPGAKCIAWSRPVFKVCDVYNEKFLESHAGQYDRVYVSFELPSIRAMCRVLRLLKIGGVLVAPTSEALCRYTRVEEAMCYRTTLTNMHFARAIHLPLPDNAQFPVFDKVPPLSHLARRVIRRELRNACYPPTVMKWMSRSILVRKGGTRECSSPTRPRRSNASRRRDLEMAPEILPPDLYFPRNRSEVGRWRERATSWVNTEGFPETNAERARHVPTRSVPRSPAPASDISTPESENWGDLEERGEGTMNREMNHPFMELMQDAVMMPEMPPLPLGGLPRFGILHRLMMMRERPNFMDPQPAPARRNHSNERFDLPEDAESPMNDPLFIDVVERDVPNPGIRPTGNLTDDEIFSDFEMELEEDESDSGDEFAKRFFGDAVDTAQYRKWLSSDPQTEEEPNLSDYDLDEPSTSSASSSSQPSTSSTSQKRTIPQSRTRRPKRARTELHRITKDEFFSMEREEREHICIKLRPKRDAAISQGAAQFQERVRKLPLPQNLQTFVYKMKSEVIFNKKK